MAEPTKRFKATGDDGLRYTICEFAPHHLEGEDTHPLDPDVGAHHFRSDDGRTVESKGHGIYVLLETGVTLRADTLDSY